MWNYNIFYQGFNIITYLFSPLNFAFRFMLEMEINASMHAWEERKKERWQCKCFPILLLIFIYSFGAIVLTFCRLRILGALEEDRVVDKNEAWRFFTCMFLHAGVVHLLANMSSLLFIGVRLEKEFGFCKHFNTYWVLARSKLLMTLFTWFSNLCLGFGSENWILIHAFWFWRKFVIYFAFDAKRSTTHHISWRIRCTLWTSGSHAFWASNKLDNLCK